MKPEGWDRMSGPDKREDAERLFTSVRGKLIIAQALAKAIEIMKEQEYPERSNIEDMEELGETLFQPFFSMYTSKLL